MGSSIASFLKTLASDEPDLKFHSGTVNIIDDNARTHQPISSYALVSPPRRTDSDTKKLERWHTGEAVSIISHMNDSFSTISSTDIQSDNDDSMTSFHQSPSCPQRKPSVVLDDNQETLHSETFHSDMIHPPTCPRRRSSLEESEVPAKKIGRRL